MRTLLTSKYKRLKNIKKLNSNGRENTIDYIWKMEIIPV